MMTKMSSFLIKYYNAPCSVCCTRGFAHLIVATLPRTHVSPLHKEMMSLVQLSKAELGI